MTRQPEHRWYLLAVKPNTERSVQHAIERMVNSDGREAQVASVVVPTHTELALRTKEKTQNSAKEVVSFPGYVLINMALDDELQWAVTTVPGIGYFVSTPDGDGERPLPMPMADHEVDAFLHGETQFTDAGLQPGDVIDVTEGPCKGMQGLVGEYHAGDHKVSVNLNIFGRVTKVEMLVSQVSKT